MTEQSQLPDTVESVDGDELEAAGFPSAMKMAPGLAIFFNTKLFNRVKQIAVIMANSGLIKHLAQKPEACFVVVGRAITWNLDPMAVAMSTYQTPNGAIGYEGKLIQAILENSGRLEGGITFTHHGDWSKVKRKFRMEKSNKPNGGQYPVPTWNDGKIEIGDLYVTVSAQVKGEAEPRTLDFYLEEAFPLNSPLWATAPHRQVRYTSVRAFANQVMPGVLMGIPFDVDPTGFYGEPVDINERPAAAARPQINEFARKSDAAIVGKAAPDDVQADNGVTEETDGSDAVHEAAVEPSKIRKTTSPPEIVQEDFVITETTDDGEQNSQADPEPAQPTAMEHGLKLLADIKAVRDIAELRSTIGAELGDEEIAAWEQACDARCDEIMKGAPKAAAKKK